MSERHAGAPGLVKEVTSLANPLVKDIKALAQKKFRDQQNAFMAEGLKLVIDALDLGWSIKTMVLAKAGRGNPAVEKVAARTVAAGGTVLEVSEKVLAAITRRDNPHLAYGSGRHNCMGAGLARMEAKIAIPALLERMPEMKLLRETQEWNRSIGLRGLVTLPVVSSPRVCSAEGVAQ